MYKPMADQVDLNAPVAAAQAQRGQLQDIFAGQRADTSNFLNQYTNLIGSQGTTQALADRIGNELNLPVLRQNAAQLQTTMSNLPFTYKAGTAGYDVNNNQLSRIIGQKAYELAPALTATTNQLNTAENVLGQRLGYAQSDWARQLLPMQTQGQMLSDRLARETTGYTQNMTNELNALIQKMQTGAQLQNSELDRMNQLAIAEKGYQNALEVAKTQAGATTSAATIGAQYHPIYPGGGIYNAATDKITSMNINPFSSSSSTNTPTPNYSKYIS